MFKAVLNDFLSWRRRLSSTERPAADLSGHRGIAPGADEAVLLRDELQSALARLTPVQRAVLVLRYHQDLPDAEIARLLDCREGTVRSHARRAMAILRTSTARTSEGTRR